MCTTAPSEPLAQPRNVGPTPRRQCEYHASLTLLSLAAARQIVVELGWVDLHGAAVLFPCLKLLVR